MCCGVLVEWDEPPQMFAFAFPLLSMLSPIVAISLGVVERESSMYFQKNGNSLTFAVAHIIYMYVVPCTLCKLHMRVNRFDKAQRVKNQTGKRYANHEKSDKLFATQLSLGKRAVAASTTDGSDGHRHSSHSCTKIMQITYTYYNVLYYTVYIYMYAVE